MYSFSYLEPVYCSMSCSNFCFLTCIQVSQEVGQLVWYSHLLQNFPQFTVIHTVKGFGIVKKAEINVFLEISCFFDDPVDIGNLISVFSAFSKTILNIWKFVVYLLLKPGLENFEHYFTSMWDECSCAVVWAFSGSLDDYIIAKIIGKACVAQQCGIFGESIWSSFYGSFKIAFKILNALLAMLWERSIFKLWFTLETLICNFILPSFELILTFSKLMT